MKSVKYTALMLTALIAVSGCDLSNTDAKRAKATYYSTAATKEVNVTESAEPPVLDLNLSSNSFIKIIKGLDSEFFSTRGNKVAMNIAPRYSNPQDSNRDNIYETKLYVVTEKEKDYILYLKVAVLENNNTEPSTPSDSNVTLMPDMDNDYIPNNIEKLLGSDPANGDENNNSIPDGLEGDPFFAKEWYIKSNGEAMNPSGIPSIKGNDLNLTAVYKEYMGYNGGNPVILQIVDSGVDITHEDLKDNIDLNRSLNGNQNGNPMPGGLYMPHGTMLAGIAAARAFNGKGVRGVAPFAKIAGSNWLVNQSLDGLEAAWYSGNGANEIAVTNNSWGTYYTADTFYEDIMEAGVKDLRDGKGRVYVFASGNAREYGADSNIQYIINNRFALVVSALDYDNKVASYSTPGANVWVAAYGGTASFNDGPTIATTYMSGHSSNTWAEDEKRNYTYAMAGTSAAAPMVTGAVALILEACPNLTWRDVKYVIAKSAKKIDSSSESWIKNGAGFNFSRDYGFGLIDTKAAIDYCKNGYINLPPQESVSVKADFNKSFEGSESEILNIDKSLNIEWVEATVDLDAQNASDFDIYIISPSGTKVLLVKHGTEIGDNFIPVKNWMRGGFRFSTGAFLDENSLGNWSLKIVNRNSGSAVLNSIKLKVYGYKRGNK